MTRPSPASVHGPGLLRGLGRRLRRPVSPAGYRRITAVTLAALVFIMVTGAAVRLTGSGLGCETWPNCESDSFTPRSASDAEGMVEFANRLVSAAVGLVTVAAVVGARWRRPRRDDLYRWSLGLPVWVFANGLVGAMVVWLHLSPVSVIGHFLLSLGAVWNAVVLHHKAGEEPGPEPASGSGSGSGAESGPEPGLASAAGEARRELAVPSFRRTCDYLLVAAGVALVTGTLVTGSGPHAGDERADRLPFPLEEIVRLHGAAVLLFLGLTLTMLWMARQGDAEASVERRLRVLLVVLVAQGGVGYAQYFTGVPAGLVGVHVLGAAVVWIAVLRVRLGLTAPAATSAPAAPAPAMTAPEASSASELSGTSPNG